MKENVFNLPQCPHLYKNICSWTTEKIGTPVCVNGPVCNITCEMFGPYCGKEINKEKQEVFIEKMNKYKYGKSLEKVRTKYSIPLKIIIPDISNTILKELKHILDISFVETILLTGSFLVDNMINRKDLDISIVVKDIGIYMNNENCILSKLPKVINGFLVDYFIKTKCSTLFMSFDLKTKILYTSNLYNIQEIDKNIKDVVYYKFED